MDDVWSHADDVAYLGPDGGFQVGWKEILGEWEKQAAMKLAGMSNLMRCAFPAVAILQHTQLRKR